MDNLTKIFYGEIEEDLINKWLSQFLPDEVPLILKLLENFKYYGAKKVNDLLKLIYAKILTEYTGKNIYYIPVGYVARSGAAVAYFFRIQNNISQTNFLTIQDVSIKEVTNESVIVLIDDFMGTGSQSVNVVERIKSELNKKGVHPQINYAIIAGLETGINYFESVSDCKVFYGESIKQSELPLAETSSIFVDKNERDKLKAILQKYGSPLYQDHPLGYKNASALVGFFYSTPNNTLPIFWGSSKDWVSLLPYSESLRDSYSLIGPPTGLEQTSLTTNENRPIIETNNLLEYDLPEEIVNVTIQEFHSLRIILTLAPIILNHNLSFQTVNSLITIIRELKHLQHEKESVCCAISIVKTAKISHLEDSVFVKPKEHTTINKHKEVITISQLIDGYSGTVIIDSNGDLLGVSNYNSTLTNRDIFLNKKYHNVASFSLQNGALIFLFEGDGKVVVFNEGERILSHRGASWHLQTSELNRAISALSIKHSIDKIILQDLIRIAFRMSNEGKGGLITIGDSDNVLKMTNLAKENFLTWKQLKILESPDEALMGLFSQDGATIISNEGLIVNSMVQLQPDPKIVCEEEVGKGMKHITAGKVSAATSTISIAISVDGRITVFADGKIRFKMMG